MALTKTSICNFGWKARDFAVKGIDGKAYTLAGVRGSKGALVAFICNHCPICEGECRPHRGGSQRAARDRYRHTGQGPEEQMPSMGCSIKWKG
jgi:peroxiredoxin